MNTFLFIPTMRCNLACHYCHFRPDKGGFEGYGKYHPLDSELRSWEWLAALERFRPYFLEITGGEPLMWKDFKDFIALLPPDATWAITSNSLLAVEGCDLSKCLSWTASFHYGHSVEFAKTLRNLSRSIKPRVSLVVEKEQVERDIILARLFAGNGYGVNLLRELNPGVDWQKGPQWSKLKAESTARGFNLVEEDIPPSYNFPQGHLCKAGMRYFCAMPDGKVYRCYSHAMLGEPLGYIGDFEPLTEAADCYVPCLGCAKDFAARKVKIADVENEVSLSMSPVPARN